MEKCEILEKIGLSKHECKVYTALVETGPVKVSDIVKHTGLHRPTVYQVLPRLKELGLITVTPKGKQKLYAPESPEKLRGLFSTLEQNFEAFLPELEESFTHRENKPLVKFLEGKKGIMFVFDDVVKSLKKGDVFYRYSSKKAITDGNKYLSKEYRQIRDKKHLERFVISNAPSQKSKKPRMERMVKIVPPEYDLFEYDVTQVIYCNKIGYVDYNSQTAIIIENPMIARFQQKIFKLLFDKL